eukprot:TRINITY_DN3973_c0_g2_i1.p2 TRINITY_DN3973_c0_g2~~TRINITY_DN3973_c0_g2_i1.p2  ORF type:complete len:66 (-),score=3.89 TRINITY_DN3973_c0_g2_i1:282-479(-)
MKVTIFTDRNLSRHLLNGWSADKLIEGKVKTLTGRTFSVEVESEKSTIKELKEKVETFVEWLECR